MLLEWTTCCPGNISVYSTKMVVYQHLSVLVRQWQILTECSIDKSVQILNWIMARLLLASDIYICKSFSMIRIYKFIEKRRCFDVLIAWMAMETLCHGVIRFNAKRFAWCNDPILVWSCFYDLITNPRCNEYDVGLDTVWVRTLCVNFGPHVVWTSRGVGYHVDLSIVGLKSVSVVTQCRFERHAVVDTMWL